MHLVGVGTFHPAGVYRGGDVVIGLRAGNGAVAVGCAGVECGVDQGVRASCGAASIDVVACNLRCASVPGEADSVLLRSDADASERL